MDTRGRELVAADEATVVAESLLDSTVVEDGQSNRGLPNTAGADESNWVKVFCEINCLLD